MVWGLGARVIVKSDYGNGYDFTIVPNHRLDTLFSAFLQDELKLAASLSLTIGSKLEHNDFTGSAFEPSAQLVWTPTEKQTVWMSASRAIREPSSVDDGPRSRRGDRPSCWPYLRDRSECSETHISKPRNCVTSRPGTARMASKRVSLDVTGFAGLLSEPGVARAQTPYFATQQGVPYLVLPELFVNGAGSPHLWRGILRPTGM